MTTISTVDTTRVKPFSTYVCTERQPTVHVQQNTFEKTLIEVGSSHLYASFGTFCVQIGQLVEAQ